MVKVGCLNYFSICRLLKSQIIYKVCLKKKFIGFYYHSIKDICLFVNVYPSSVLAYLLTIPILYLPSITFKINYAVSTWQQLILNRNIIYWIPSNCYLLLLWRIEIVYLALNWTLVQFKIHLEGIIFSNLELLNLNY